MRDLCKVLYVAFKPHVARYPSLEGSLLVDEMSALNQDPSKDIVDELRNVGGTVAKSLALVEVGGDLLLQLGRHEGLGLTLNLLQKHSRL